MSYAAVILTDSAAPSGVRLTSALITMPRMILCELSRHRMFSFSVASSRAIPTAKLLEQVREHPVQPLFWGRNQAGMQAEEELSPAEREAAQERWLLARSAALWHAEGLARLGAHKQIVNRLLEPFLWTSVLMTGCSPAFANLFWLRCHPDAQPELRHAMERLRAAYFASEPEELQTADWHLPFVPRAERQGPLAALLATSVARCARVSYERHDAPTDPEADQALMDRLRSAGHWSPFEHQAQAARNSFDGSGNLDGWLQFRHMFPGESVTDLERVRPKRDDERSGRADRPTR